MAGAERKSQGQYLAAKNGTNTLSTANAIACFVRRVRYWKKMTPRERMMRRRAEATARLTQWRLKYAQPF